uniref:Uncharacterized protein n=1 Tax=Fagus sylvatica TaxID=28930 RepID=A0A2N9EAB8_FAGSY
MLEYGEIGRLELVRRTCQWLEEAAVADLLPWRVWRIGWREIVKNRWRKAAPVLVAMAAVEPLVLWLGWVRKKIRKSKKGSGIPEFAGVVGSSRRVLFKEIERGGGEAEVTGK